MRKNSWLLLMPVCLGLTACDESFSPTRTQTPSPVTGSTAALKASPSSAEVEPRPPESLPAEPAEKTFGSIPSPKEMMAVLRERLRDPVDTKEEEEALAKMEGELAGFTYVPSSELTVADSSVEEPLRESFIADSEWAAEHLKKLYGDSLQVSCLSRPCLRYADFDADGKRDLVVQVSDDKSDKVGIAFLLADDTHALIGAGREGPLGDDLLWVDAWQVDTSPKDGAAVLLSSAAKAARVALSSAEKGGSRAVKAGWSCEASSQVPPLGSSKDERGTLTRSGTFEGADEYDAWRAFDDDATRTRWVSEAWSKSPVWIGYEWKDGPRRITSYALTLGDLASRSPRDFELQGSNDGETWVTVDERTGELEWKDQEERRYNITRPVAFNRYRLFITEDNDDRGPIVAISLGHITLSGANCDVAVK